MLLWHALVSKWFLLLFCVCMCEGDFSVFFSLFFFFFILAIHFFSIADKVNLSFSSCRYVTSHSASLLFFLDKTDFLFFKVILKKFIFIELTHMLILSFALSDSFENGSQIVPHRFNPPMSTAIEKKSILVKIKRWTFDVLKSSCVFKLEHEM